MKTYIGKYKYFFGPYQLAEALCFWVRERRDEHGFPSKPDWVHNFGEWLAHGSVEPEPKVGQITSWDRERKKTLLYRFLLWVDSHRKRRIYVKIDPWDVWSMDHTLALIILPMLRLLQEKNNGAPCVEDGDVPEYLRSTAAPPREDENDVDANHFLRWDWVLGEMIWCFEQELDEEAENKFYTGESQFQWRKLKNGCSEMITGPNHTFKVDNDGLKAWQERRQNGLRLFGKYYHGLWW